MTSKQKLISLHDEENVKGFFGQYRFLSNFYEAEVWFEGIKYPSTENAYQAAKFSEDLRMSFVNISQSESKNRAYVLEKYIRQDWKEIKIDVMRSVLVDKFNRHLDLREKLLNTEGKYLEETNYWGDQFWGFCNGEGENHLGRLLMSIRDMFKQYPTKKKLKETPLF